MKLLGQNKLTLSFFLTTLKALKGDVVLWTAVSLDFFILVKILPSLLFRSLWSQNIISFECFKTQLLYLVFTSWFEISEDIFSSYLASSLFWSYKQNVCISPSIKPKSLATQLFFDNKGLVYDYFAILWMVGNL